ncbi:MAG: VOC family protein [Ilumatobacteraceae bacterium]|jgi:uncharacterized glyoxalase superfamily protein PhnB
MARPLATATGAEVGIVSVDADALAAFYCTGMGFTVERRLEFPQGVVLRMVSGAARCKIFQPAGGAVVPPPAPVWHHGAGMAYAALHVTDAGALVDHAVAAGAEVITPVQSHRPGARFAMIRDPQGNVWEILEEDDPAPR